MSVDGRIAELEGQIKELKRERDELLRKSGATRSQIAAILKARTPTRTLCQMLRELHDRLGDSDKGVIEECLLIAKKMDDSIARYAGAGYSERWYDKNGRFIK